MDRNAILEFARRDWSKVAELKAAFWLGRKHGHSAAEVLADADALRRHAQAMKPGWPSQGDRLADIAVHQRVAEALHAVDLGSR